MSMSSMGRSLPPGPPRHPHPLRSPRRRPPTLARRPQRLRLQNTPKPNPRRIRGRPKLRSNPLRAIIPRPTPPSFWHGRPESTPHLSGSGVGVGVGVGVGGTGVGVAVRRTGVGVAVGGTRHRGWRRRRRGCHDSGPRARFADAPASADRRPPRAANQRSTSRCGRLVHRRVRDVQGCVDGAVQLNEVQRLAGQRNMVIPASSMTDRCYARPDSSISIVVAADGELIRIDDAGGPRRADS